MKDFHSPACKRARAAYTAQCAFQYFVTLLAADAFLAKLLTYIGISDALTGILSSFITLAFVFEILTLLILHSRLRAKPIVIIGNTVSIFFFMLLYLIPFLPVSRTGATVLATVCILIAYISNYLISAISYRWANAYVCPTGRARFSAVKEMVSLFSGMLFTAIVGYVIDRFDRLGETEKGFLFIAAAILILNICNFVALMMIGGRDDEQQSFGGTGFRETLKGTFGNRHFRRLVIQQILWYVATYLTFGFIGVFKINDLLYSVLAVQIMNIAASLIRLILSAPLGRFSDRYSYAKGFRIGLYLLACAFFINIFTTYETRFLIIGFTVLYQASLAGTNQNSFNMTYHYIQEKYITQAIAIKDSIGGLCGFAASLLGGKILTAVQQNGNCLFGIPVYGQQVLSAFSFLLVLVAVLFTKFVIEKQSVTVQ